MRIRARLLVVTDPSYPEDEVCSRIARAAAGVPPGGLAVQLRDASRSDDALQAYAVRLRALTRDLGVTLVLNGRPELACAIGADGIHLGSRSGSIAAARCVAGREAWVSAACHADEEVGAAIAEGADAVLVSPIFDTPSGGGKCGRGLAALREARRIVDVAGRDVLVYALGGVSRENASDCFEAGADGVACIRAVLDADDAADAARALSVWRPGGPGATFTRR